MTLQEQARKHALPDPHDEREVLHADLLRALADELDRQAAEIAALRKDAERLDWLDDNIFHREMNDWDKRQHKRKTMWVTFAPDGVQGTARAIIDAALAQGEQACYR